MSNYIILIGFGSALNPVESNFAFYCLSVLYFFFFFNLTNSKKACIKDKNLFMRIYSKKKKKCNEP